MLILQGQRFKLFDIDDSSGSRLYPNCARPIMTASSLTPLLTHEPLSHNPLYTQAQILNSYNLLQKNLGQQQQQQQQLQQQFPSQSQQQQVQAQQAQQQLLQQHLANQNLNTNTNANTFGGNPGGNGNGNGSGNGMGMGMNMGNAGQRQQQPNNGQQGRAQGGPPGGLNVSALVAQAKANNVDPNQVAALQRSVFASKFSSKRQS